MNTTQAQQIIAARAAFTGTDAEFVTAANVVPEPTWREAWVTANTIRANLAMGGPAVATAIYSTMVAAGIPDQAATFAAVGFDMGTAAARAGVSAMFSAGVITSDQAEAIVAPARVAVPSQAQAWGLETLTEANLADAQRIETFIKGQTRQAVYALLYTYNALMAKMDQLCEAGAACPTFAELSAMIEE